MRYEFLDNKRKHLGIFVEREEDLWLIYTLLKRGDIVTKRTVRDVSAGEKGEARRIPMVLSIEVSSLEFQPFTNRLRIRGVIKEGPERYGLKGHYHTFSVQRGSYINVYRESGWTTRDIRRIERYSKPSSRVLVISVDDDEMAVGEYSTIGLRPIFDISLPTVGKAYEHNELEREAVIEEGLKKTVDLIREGGYLSILITGPSMWIEGIRKRIQERLRDIKLDISSEPRPHGGVKGLKDAERSELLQNLLKSTLLRAASETLEEILDSLASERRMVSIGLDEVKRAAEMKAISRLLILDELLTTFDEKIRNLIDEILINAEEGGGEIIIVPSSTNIAEKLKGLGGIAALLRYELFG